MSTHNSDRQVFRWKPVFRLGYILKVDLQWLWDFTFCTQANGNIGFSWQLFLITYIVTIFFFSIIFTGSCIERLCEIAATDPLGYQPSDGPLGDRGAMVRAARTLLSSVTRVLLLADIVVVKQLLLAKDKVNVIL